MIKTLTAIGNSLGIIIDKPILELLNIDKDTPLEVRTDGAGLIIRPVHDDAPARPATHGGATPPPPAPPPAAPPAAADDNELLNELEDEPPAAPPPPTPPPPSSSPSSDLPPTKHADDDAAPADDTSGAEVVVMLKGDEVMRIPLDREEMVIGRDSKADLHLDDRALSRRHATIEKRGASIWVADLKSANGTFINGEKVDEPRRLHAGDVVGVGHYRIHIEGVSEAAEDMPVLTLTGPEGTHRFAMVGQQIIIGRSQTCDISIGHKSISRRHVRIAQEGDGFVVEDLGSQNGAKLNGKTMSQPQPFKVGDRIDVCDFSLELGYLQDESSQSAAPEDGDKPKRPATMLIDKSAMAQAAYVDGDFENVKSKVMSAKSAKGAKLDTGEYDVNGDPSQAPPPPKAKKKPRVVRGKMKKRGA
jgi:pSer/pThr/pTyr-binding forkhead associated (FHA) protein